MADLKGSGIDASRSPSAIEANFRLGSWLVEPALNRMTGFSREEHLHPKAMEVLLCLAARSGGVVSREDILDQVWSGTFVSDQVLANAVWELRRALGDDARDPHCIETVPKRGYRLLLPVSKLESSDPAAPAAPAAPLARPRARLTTETESAPAAEPTVARPEAAATETGGPELAGPELAGTEVAGTEVAGPEHVAEDANEVAAKVANEVEDGGAPRAGSRWSISRQRLGIAILCLALAAGAVIWFWRSRTVTPSASTAERPLVVAILPFENNTGDPSLDWLSLAVPDVLAHEMATSKHLEVLDSSRLSVAIKKRGGPSHGIDVARHQGAEIVVSGRLTGSAESLHLFSLFADLDGVARSFEVEAKDPQILFNRLAGQLRLALEIEAADEDASAISATGTTSLDAYRRYIEGRRQVLANQGEMALVDLQAAVQLDPSFALAHAELAHVYDILGHGELASASIERAIDLSAGRPPAERIGFLRLQARIHGQVAQERDYLQQLVTLHPRDAYWFGTLAWFQFTYLRECEEAIVRYRQALALEEEPHLYAYLGEAAMSCDRPKEALEAVKRTVELEPENPNRWSFLGYLQILTGDDGAAERSIARALDLAPENVQALFVKALFLADRQRYDAALEVLRRHRGLQFSPIEERQGFVAEAEIHLLQGDLDAARRAADRALELAADAPEALWIEGLVDLARGEVETAKRRLARLETVFSGSQSRYGIYFLEHLRGKILAQAGAWTEAAQSFAEALRARPLEQERYRLDLAQALLESGDAEAATGVLYQLLEINSNHAPAHCLAAEAHQRAGRPQAALLEQRACDELRAALKPPAVPDDARDGISRPSP